MATLLSKLGTCMDHASALMALHIHSCKEVGLCQTQPWGMTLQMQFPAVYDLILMLADQDACAQCAVSCHLSYATGN